jgi:hypothetical protein
VGVEGVSGRSVGVEEIRGKEVGGGKFGAFLEELSMCL